MTQVLAGGLKVGDVVYSTATFTHGGKSIKPGDKGTVQGPCTIALGDRADRVLVEFENGLRSNRHRDVLSKDKPSKVRPAYVAMPQVLRGPRERELSFRFTF